MKENYLTYPCKVMRITQSYDGRTSHEPHMTGNPKDYSLDEGCSNSGREGFYCNCDELRIKRIYGVGNGGTNALFFESTKKCVFPDGTTDYASGLIIHPNDSDLKRLKKGQKLKRGQLVCYEGTDGASGNHLHFSFGKGKLTGNGWTKNSKGKYVLTTTNGTYKPEQLLFVDPAFTKIIDSKGLKFKELPKYETGKYTVTADTLNVRTGPGTNYDKVPYKKFKAAGKRQIKKLKGKDYKKDHFVKGMSLKITQIKNDVWGKCPSGWVHLDYCKKKG